MEASNPLTIIFTVVAVLWAIVAFLVFRDMSKKIDKQPVTTQEEKQTNRRLRRVRWLVAICWPIVFVLKAS